MKKIQKLEQYISAILNELSNKPMKIAPYTVYDRNDNPIGTVKASSKAEAFKLAKQKYPDTADVTRVTAWQIKRSRS